MSRFGKWLRYSVGAALALGFILLSAMGILWMILNFTEYFPCGQTDRLIAMTTDLRANEYEGVLYPLLIMLANILSKLCKIPFYIFIYILQIFISLYACILFSCSVVPQNKKLGIAGGIALGCFPFFMQNNMMIALNSLVFSLMLIVFSFIVTLMKSEKPLGEKAMWTMGLLYLLLSLLKPDMLVIALIPFLLFTVLNSIKSMRLDRKGLFYIVCMVLCLGISVLAVIKTTSSDNDNRPSRSIAYYEMYRLCYPGYQANIDKLPDEAYYLAYCSPSGDCYAENGIEIAAVFEENFGKDSAKRYCRELAKLCFDQNRAYIIKSMLWDFVGYNLSPAVVLRQLHGKGLDSYTSVNILHMMGKTPALTMIYIKYGCLWFVFSMILGGASLVARHRQKLKYGTKGMIISAVIMELFVSLLLTLRGAGMYDYRLSITGLSFIFAMILDRANEGFS